VHPNDAGDTVDQNGTAGVETVDGDQGAAYWRGRAVAAECRVAAETARADDAEASLRSIANALVACRAVPGPV
jgi:hypothetical protein